MVYNTATAKNKFTVVEGNFMNLKNIIKNLKFTKSEGTLDIEVVDITYDSRKVKKGYAFVCLVGHNSDGHDYIQDAIDSGASVIISQIEIAVPSVTVIQVENTRTFLAGMCVNFFEHPAKKLVTIGITGTKGKTTTSFMIKSILESQGKKVGLIGTIGAVYSDKVVKLNNTTPESYELQKNLKQMYDEGYTHCVIEASSIGLKDHRLDGITFNFGIFTNFSHDHIGKDEHKDINEYLECKSMLFKKCEVGFVNIDDERYTQIIKNHTCKIKTYGLKHKPDYKAENIKLLHDGSNIGVKFDFVSKDVSGILCFAIPGRFNVYNALAAASVCLYMGIKYENVKVGLMKSRVKGRVEALNISDKYSLFIDYAHNALSMENILMTFKEYEPKRLITLFGAGGNRPKIRRYEMGEISGKYSDLSVITSDNPRFENPLDIIEDIKVGINKSHGKYVVIPDRKEAIRYCIENARSGDIIILAGKGHEDYQEINGKKYPMDERNIVKDVCAELNTNNKQDIV